MEESHLCPADFLMILLLFSSQNQAVCMLMPCSLFVPHLTGPLQARFLDNFKVTYKTFFQVPDFKSTLTSDVKFFCCLSLGSHSIIPSVQFIRSSCQVYWGGLPFPPPAGHVLSELSAMTHPSWVLLHGMVHSFTELHKLLCHDKAVIHEGMTDFLFLGSKITADGDCSHEIRRCFLLGRKAMTNLDSILKCQDITFLTKIHIVKAMVFPVVM